MNDAHAQIRLTAGACALFFARQFREKKLTGKKSLLQALALKAISISFL
jgi:hypothetical protein